MEFLLQPLEQISPGGRFPQPTWRPVGILTFRSGAILGLPAILSTEEPAERIHVGHTINIDFPANEEAAVWELLGPVQQAGWKYSEPRRSPASMKTAPRLRIQLYTGQLQCTAFDAAVFAQQLQQQLVPRGGAAARGDVFLDDSALLMSVASSAAFAVAGRNCAEIYPLAPKMAVIRTTLDENRWEADLSAWMQQDATAAIYHLRHKRLVREGSLWISAPGTANKQRQMAAGTAEVSTKLLLQLQGPAGPRPEAVVATIARLAGEAVGRTVTAVPHDAALSAYNLRPERGVVAGSFTGRLEFTVSTAAEARHVRELLHGRGIQLGPDLVSLDVQLTPLQTRSGNDRRC